MLTNGYDDTFIGAHCYRSPQRYVETGAEVYRSLYIRAMFRKALTGIVLSVPAILLNVLFWSLVILAVLS